MSLFLGRDRTGANVDFVANGTNSALQVAVATLPMVPTLLGVETLTISSTAVGLADIPAGATHALVTLEGGDVRFWEDGTTPTAVGDFSTDTGLLFITGNSAELTNLSTLLFIKASGEADARLQVSYRKYGP